MRSLSVLLGTSLALLLAAASGCADAHSPLGLLPAAQAQSQPPSDTQLGVEFVSGYQEALSEARQSGKPLLVFFSTSECVYCRQMLKETFCDQQVVRLAGQFVCVRIEADEDPQICKDFHIEAYPTVQFIGADGIPLHRVLGKKEPTTLASQMQAALEGPRARTAYRNLTERR